MVELDLDIVKRLFSPGDYSRGMQYYMQGRVLETEVSSHEDGIHVEGKVQGTRQYAYRFRLMKNGQMSLGCSCPRFWEDSRCKHLAAAMIQYVWEKTSPSKASVTDAFAQMILRHYADRDTAPPPQQATARLVPKLVTDSGVPNAYPTLTFRVGQDRLYAVKNIQSFLETVRDKKTAPLGKHVSLDHSLEQFEPRSQALIRILMNEFPAFRSISRHNYGEPGPRQYKKNELTLTGDAFDRLFDLWENETLEDESGNVTLRRGDPRLTLKLSKTQQYAHLQILGAEGLHFFGSSSSLYACGNQELLRCSDEFRDRVYPLLAQDRHNLKFAFEDLPALCACVLPELEGYATVEDPDHLLSTYLPEEPDCCFWFDMEEDVLSLRITFRYGTLEIPENPTPGQAQSLLRDIRKEKQASALAARYFEPHTNGYLLVGEDAVYGFLTDSLPQFRALGEVYLSDALRRRRIIPSKATLGVSLADGMLVLDLDTGDFPAGELEALYQSLLRRKKYHRLKDGRFLTLDGSGYEKLAEMAHMLQLSAGELKTGTLKIPAFRGLYLDSVITGSNDLELTRDRQYRQMIRSFKSVAESDYTLPPHMENLLRPYQKTGFRWLKTLESCGFGGILADEMGLGKTVQIIAYLSSLDREQTGHPSLIVCPASLVLNWSEEIARFSPGLKAAVLVGNAPERKKRMAESEDLDVWITSYELLRQDIATYQELTFYACILDEGQHIKNQSTLVSRAVKAVNCRQRFVLTGTPIENRLSELWNLFDFLMPGYLFSHHGFVEKLEKPIVKSQNPEAGAQLRKLVQPFLLRRMKKDVLKELPPKIEYIRRIQQGETERKTYLSAVHAAKSTLGDSGKLQILAALTQLRQICCDPALCFQNYSGESSKLEACLELCAAMTANGHQILLFSQFTSMLDILRKGLDGLGISSYTLQGSTPKEQRAKLVKQFNNGGASVFLISLKAGGTGLNLTAADVVIHYDPWWNLAAQNQATDRAHRIGQQQCVHVYKLIARGTIEEKILDLQEKKSALLDIISTENEGSILNMSKEDLLALLEE